jgi:hypothetical protein
MTVRTKIDGTARLSAVAAARPLSGLLLLSRP